MKPQKECCGNCMYYQPVDQNGKPLDMGLNGMCRRNPPSVQVIQVPQKTGKMVNGVLQEEVTISNSVNAMFAPVTAATWCGEWDDGSPDPFDDDISETEKKAIEKPA